MPDLNAIGIVSSDLGRVDRVLPPARRRLPGGRRRGTSRRSCRAACASCSTPRTCLSFRPEWTRETGNQLALAFECASPAEVDAVYERAAGRVRSREGAVGRVLGSALRAAPRPRRRAGRPVRAARELDVACARCLPRGAAARDDCVSLRRMFATCRCTVCSLRTSDEAISRFERPAATRRSTSASRRETAASRRSRRSAPRRRGSRRAHAGPRAGRRRGRCESPLSATKRAFGRSAASSRPRLIGTAGRRDGAERAPASSPAAGVAARR